MAFTLTLNGNSSILSADFFPPIDLKNNEYVCGLVDFQTYNSIPNIDEGCNKFIYDENLITIPTGSYEIIDIENFLKVNMGIAKVTDDYNASADLKNQFVLRANNNTLKCEIYSSKSVDFTQKGSIGSLLGFTKRILAPNEWHESDLYVDINKINIIRIECNIIGSTYMNGEEAHILHEFSIDVSPGYKIIEVPRNVIYLPVTVKQIRSLTIRIIDQDSNLINFRGETITARVHLKPL